MKKIFLLILLNRLLYGEFFYTKDTMYDIQQMLYKEYLNQREYKKKNYKHSKVQYFELIEYERHPTLMFSFPIRKSEIENRYVRVTFVNNQAVEMEEYDFHNSKYNGISYLDEETRVMEKYYKDGSYLIVNYNNDKSEERIFCENKEKKKVCTVRWSLVEDKDVVNSSHGIMIYKEYPNEMLTGEEYLKRIKEKRGKVYFSKLLQEEQKKSTLKINYFQEYQVDKNSSIKFLTPTTFLTKKYIKVFYKDKKPISAQWYKNSQLTKSIKLNDLAQIKEIIDFRTKSIKEYRYGRKNHSIDEIECFYLKDICSVKEISVFTRFTSPNMKRLLE